MARFNRERAKAELGWTDNQINEYLRSPQAQQDSAAAAEPVAQPPAESGSDPLGAIAGMGAGALESIGGPRTLITAGGLGGAGLLARHLLRNRGQAAPPPGPPPPPPGPPPTRTTAPKLSPSLYALTEDDVKRIPQFKGARPGQEIRRATYEKYAFPEAPTRTTKPAAKREPMKLVAGGKSTSKEPTKPIKVEGKPKARRLAKQRGVSQREIASRQQGMARAASLPDIPEDDLMAQLERSLAAEEAMTARGVPKGGARVPLRAGLRGKIPGALGLLMTLLDAQSFPQQIDEAGSAGRQFLEEDMRRRGRFIPDAQEIY